MVVFVGPWMALGVHKSLGYAETAGRLWYKCGAFAPAGVFFVAGGGVVVQWSGFSLGLSCYGLLGGNPCGVPSMLAGTTTPLQGLM